MTTLSGVVIVTGAASGLGRESARHFADCGATVVAVDINRQGLDEIASERIDPFVADVTRSARLHGRRRNLPPRTARSPAC